MFCTNCGAKLNDDAKFCHACGSKAAEQTAEEEIAKSECVETEYEAQEADEIEDIETAEITDAEATEKTLVDGFLTIHEILVNIFAAVLLGVMNVIAVSLMKLIMLSGYYTMPSFFGLDSRFAETFTSGFFPVAFVGVFLYTIALLIIEVNSEYIYKALFVLSVAEMWTAALFVFLYLFQPLFEKQIRGGEYVVESVRSLFVPAAIIFALLSLGFLAATGITKVISEREFSDL